MENDTMTDITKQRLIGSLLLLLVISATAFFLIGKTNDDKVIVVDEDPDFVSSIEPMPVEFMEVDQETLLDPHQLEEQVEVDIIDDIAIELDQITTTPPVAIKKEAPIIQPVEVKKELSTDEVSKPSWIIQLGSFSVQENAKALHDKATKLDLASKIEQSGSNYRVRIGPEYDKQRVDAIVEKLSKQLGITPQVLSQQTEVKQ